MNVRWHHDWVCESVCVVPLLLHPMSLSLCFFGGGGGVVSLCNAGARTLFLRLSSGWVVGQPTTNLPALSCPSPIDIFILPPGSLCNRRRNSRTGREIGSLLDLPLPPKSLFPLLHTTHTHSHSSTTTNRHSFLPRNFNSTHGRLRLINSPQSPIAPRLWVTWGSSGDSAQHSVV